MGLGGHVWVGGWVWMCVCVDQKVSSKLYKGRGGSGRGGGNRKPSACLMLPGGHEQVL